MSGIVRHRHPWRRALRLALVAAGLGALTGTLALAMQVRRVHVTGAQRFPAREVEQALVASVGERVVATSVEHMREQAMAVPWVGEAVVRMSLDGTVTCQITEREPVAVALDVGSRQLVDATGRLLGDHESERICLELRGFAPYPSERVAVLGTVRELERHWGGRLAGIERLGPADVALTFVDTPFSVVADPSQPELLAPARAVAAAWTTGHRVPPLRLDARVAGRVALLPAPPPDDGGVVADAGGGA